ncbi:MAG: tetratricopeptide repeat protein [Bacteroidetes bacterium]|nr:tetratricopeptide repeat protein [Bacteroidota bacterium]
MKRKNLQIIIRVIKNQSLLVFIILTFLSCSTEKNRFLNRAYHSINTKYNGYFNARESYNNALKSLERNHLDNYEEVLSIFMYGTEQSRKSVSSNMDIAYEKCSRVIRKHSMNIKNVEYNKFIDDAYFLIAKSHFFKDDHTLAIIMFEYIIRQYDTPLKYESKIWIAKSRIQMNKFEMADQILINVQKDFESGLLQKNAIRLYNLVRADYFIKQEKYEDAIPFLNEGIKLTKNKKDRTRLTFILGQVYYRSGNYLEAQRAFASVLRMNPEFDMAFRARINMAMSFDPRSGNLKAIKDDLNKLLASERNKEFRDEIYYALGMLELRQDNKTKAIEYFIESTKVSDKNKFQKGLSFLRLGELHFEMPKYLKASIYYDSVIAFISTDYSDYEVVKDRQKILFDLAKHIRIIEREDSLQRLASMTSAERNRIVDEIIRNLREQEQLEREKETERMRQMQQIMGRETSRSSGGVTEQGGSAWYFYNTSTINFGKTEFYAKWGSRQLEDLWRISNKQVISFGMDGDIEDGEEGDETAASDKYNRQTYLDNIPLTSEKLDLSNKKISDALYNKGLILKNRLKDDESAIQSFNELIRRFPEFEQKLNTYYYLYTMTDAKGDKTTADVYKIRIIDEFPDSDYAKILRDPNYAENIRARKTKADRLYSQSYEAFLLGNYSVVLSNYKILDTIEVEKPLKARFIYLTAVTYGKQEEIQKMKTELENIIDNYQDTPLFNPAKELWELVSKIPQQEVVADTGQSDKEFVSIYLYDPSAIHFFALVVDSKNMPVREVRSKMNKFHKETYPDINLSISNIFLNDKQQLITVTNFQGMEKAMEYYGKIVENNLLGDYEIEHYEAFLISVENYPIFYQNKNLEDYLRFYRNFYFQ